MELKVGTYVIATGSDVNGMNHGYTNGHSNGVIVEVYTKWKSDIFLVKFEPINYGTYAQARYYKESLEIDVQRYRDDRLNKLLDNE